MTQIQISQLFDLIMRKTTKICQFIFLALFFVCVHSRLLLHLEQNHQNFLDKIQKLRPGTVPIPAPAQGIRFLPFPPVPAGKSIWSVITPKYRSKNPTQTALAHEQAQHTTTVEPQHLQTPNKDAVRNYIWNWMANPQGGSLNNENNPAGQGVMEDNKELKCVLKIFNYSNPSEDLMNSDQSMDVLYPGSFVQGRRIDSGAESLEKLPISHAYRWPIRVAGNGNFAPVWANSSQAGDVHRTLKQAIWNSEGFYSADVYLKLVNSTEITSLLLTLNFNAKIAKALDISGGFTGNWKTKKNKFFITMIQGIADFFPDKIVSDNSAINDAVGVFLRENFTLAEARQIQTLGFWGRHNIPCYVNQVTYGRMIIISVEENQKTRSLYAQLSASYSTVGSLNMSMTMTQMFQDSSVKVFSVGPFSNVEITDLKSGNWTSFFSAIPANSSLIQSMKPVGFRVQDFKGQNVKVTNRLQYEQVQCQTKPTKNIKIQVKDVFKSVSIQIKRTGENSFTEFASWNEGTTPVYDITSQLTSGDNDELRISNTGATKGFMTRWQRKANLVVMVDGVVVYNKVEQCKGCHSESDAFRCRIDKYSGAVSCQSK